MTIGEKDMENQTDKLNSMGRARWEEEQRRVLVSRLVRWGIGIPLILFCFPIPWFGPFLALLGVVMIIPDIADYLSGFAGNIIWSHRAGQPQPLYSIPESLVASGRYEEAEAEYEKIIKEFPKEVKPHVDLINIAVTRLNDGELAERLYQRGLSILQDAATRDVLTKMYNAISTRLKTTSYVSLPEQK